MHDMKFRKEPDARKEKKKERNKQPWSPRNKIDTNWCKLHWNKRERKSIYINNTPSPCMLMLFR